MHNDKVFLGHLKKLIEQKIGWGDSAGWVNQDFIALSNKIQTDTGSPISHVTLKRIWGKVKYEGLPQVYTLNTLAQFAGYESWRDFMVRCRLNSYSQAQFANVALHNRKNPMFKTRMLIFSAATASVIVVMVAAYATRKIVYADQYKFSSHTTAGAAIPNSVVFDYDAKNAPDDSVVIQQSWDKRLRTTVSKNQRQHTLIYYYPGFFQPKLLIGGHIVKEHDLLIPSGGWVTAIMHTPVPVYFQKDQVIRNGHMALQPEQITAQHIALNPDALSVSYCNVRDFGLIYSDDFEFETSVRNDFNEGSSICQLTNIYLLCKGTAIDIPLCAKGCESALNFFFTGYSVSGKQKDLSVFGVDFKKFVNVRVRCSKGRAEIYFNSKLVYSVEKGISHARIIGIDYVFQGTGSVDYARLSNKSISFDDEF